MVKSEGNKGSRAKDVMNVMYQQKEKTHKKNNKKGSQGTKMRKKKKSLASGSPCHVPTNERITNNFPLLVQEALEDHLMRDEVKCIYHIHL
jgi:hypothetical protein